MVGRKRTVARASSRRNAAGAQPTRGQIYQDMLAEAGVNAVNSSPPERPLKRRRPGSRREEKAPVKVSHDEASSSEAPQYGQLVPGDGEDDDDEDIEFQDVVLPEPTMQTMELESDDEEENEDIQFEDVDFGAPLKDLGSTSQQPKDLELNLTAQKSTAEQIRKATEKRKPISQEERKRRIEIHKAHLVCLLSHVARRNHWCNDAKVQDYLRPHLTDKVVTYLNPGTSLSQFGRTESLKNGLKQTDAMWKTKFEVTERGLRRALWAEEVEHLKDYEPPSDMESCLDRQDFREAAKKLQGSRDVGAQLYCALLRSAGVRARLVCSLQPLACTGSAPTLPKPKHHKPTSKVSRSEQVRAAAARYREMANASYSLPASGSTARRRLGHPNATAYNFEPPVAPPKPKPSFDTRKRIKESSYPVYWVEILDVGHQKWQPVDAVVTNTFWKPNKLEPPITDKENCLSYVVAFEADGSSKDVTRRYAKAFTAKTRRSRVDTVAEDGDQWWRKIMKLYSRRAKEDLDQIEDNELAGIEAREPMPRNVQDFKNHPIFALERHLRRHEVLVPGATPSGTISAGSRAPLERIYRRKDVRVARSADRWYRLGREVKPNEIPAKWLPKKAKPKGRLDDEEDDGQGDAGTPVYTEDQTELYEPPRVRNGRVPKNKFGNIDVYVPSMVPLGGVHIVHEYASRAAFILGVDYAPALTGFQFKGRHGTAVLNGIVVAKEYEAAVRAVIDGLGGLEQEMEDERRKLRAFRVWRRFLMGLRIREQIWAGVDEDERREADDKAAREAKLDEAMVDASSDVTEEFDMVNDEGGGFLID
ncbi:Fc.00g038670.m01.CDS01 [Cosmosporella sp. VM-42]